MSAVSPDWLMAMNQLLSDSGGHVDIAGQARQPLEPVFRDMARQMRGAATDQRDAVHAREIQPLGKHDPVVLDVMVQHVADHHRLLSDFLGHEMPVAALVDRRRAHVDPAFAAADRTPPGLIDLHARAGQDGVVAILQIGDAVGKGRQGHRIRTQKHLARAMADGQRAAPACRDHQIALALEQEGQREGAVQAGQGGARGLQR